MQTSRQNKNYFIYFFVLVLWMWIAIYLQSYGIYMLPKPFNSIDLATVSILCICIENSLWISFFVIIVAGSLLDYLSAIKPGFFLLYFLISMLVIQVTSKFFSYEYLINKFLIFNGLFLLKFFFIYLIINNESVSVSSFISHIYLQFLVSNALFFLVTKFVHLCKFTFEGHEYTNKAYFKRVQ